MTNDDNARSDLEVGKKAEVNSPSRQKNPSTMTKPISKYLSWKEPKRILRCFDLTKNTTQQKALVLLCVGGAILDPLFFYILIINEASKCMKSDRKLAAVAISLRSLVDLLHSLLWWRYYSEKWKTERSESAATCPAAASVVAVAVSTTTSSEENKEISQGNSNSTSPRNCKVTRLLIELLSILPLPQAATLAILIIQGSPRSQHAVTLLKFSVLVQFIIRIFRVIPSFGEATKNSFTLLKSRFWIGAMFNLLLFMIFSHVLGAFWYLLSVGRMMDCWKSACRKQVGCSVDSLYCGGPMDNKSYLDHNCPIEKATNSSAFDFGIYLEALDSNIVGPTRFPLKLIYCFWWGLRNLSSLGQNLEASAYEWEILFSICISVFGLILVSFFIGNMQAVFQYKTNKDLEKMDQIDKKRRELLKWKPFEGLPLVLWEEIIFCTNDRWLETPEVDLRTMINYLPEGLGERFKESIFLKLQTKVKLCQALDMQACLKPEVFAEGSLVFKKGQAIDKMVFILDGKLSKQNGSDGSTGQDLQAWDFCGEELVETIHSSLQPQSPKTTPEWTVDIKACTKVEAFILEEGDLQKLVDAYSPEDLQKLLADFQYITNKDFEKMTGIIGKIEKKQRELLKWEPFRWLPQDLQDEIIFCTKDRWLETTEVNLRTMMNYLPEGLDKKFKESILSKLLEKMRLFPALDIQALNLMNYLKPEEFPEGSFVFRKGHPIDKMVFILNGKLTKQTGIEGSTPQELRVWDCLGQELLEDISGMTQSSIKVPLSPADIKTCTKVEALILDTSDLQKLVNQFMDTTKNKKSAASKKAGQSAVHIQKYRLLAMKQRDLSKWQPFRWLPQDLQEEIILCNNARWLETTEVNLQTMINYLPEGLNKRFKESIFSKLQKKVRLFRALDMRACVKPEVFAEGSLVFKKGLPIDKMVFILNGKLSKKNGSGGSTAQDLHAWDFCGEELLDITRSLPKPTWTADIIACTKVEAFSLDAGDLQTRLNQLNMSVERENFMFEIWTSIIEYETAMEDAIKKQKKAEKEDAIKKQKKAEEKPNGITKSASFKESSRDNKVGQLQRKQYVRGRTLSQ